MIDEKNIFKKNSNLFETAYQNQTRNNNERNNELTIFFASLLKCSWFKRLILSALTVIVAKFFMLFVFLGIFIFIENQNMINVVLDILFKIFMPCAMIFVFFIRFGDYNKK